MNYINIALRIIQFRNTRPGLYKSIMHNLMLARGQPSDYVGLSNDFAAEWCYDMDLLEKIYRDQTFLFFFKRKVCIDIKLSQLGFNVFSFIKTYELEEGK